MLGSHLGTGMKWRGSNVTLVSNSIRRKPACFVQELGELTGTCRPRRCGDRLIFAFGLIRLLPGTWDLAEAVGEQHLDSI